MSACPAGRPTWVDINLAALRWNYRQVRRLLAPQVKILAVVKADAYGHGAKAIGRTLIECGADALGVASVEEAMELRQAGIRRPLVIFGLIQTDEAEAVVQAGLQPTVVLPSQLQALERAAGRLRKKVDVHLKIDTGMGRIGILPEATPDFMRRLAKSPHVRLTGVYSHFAHADGNRQWVKRQHSRLQQAVAAVRAAYPEPVLVHAANSAAVLQSAETHLDMVRPGLMLYGLYPAPGFRRYADLKPVLQWFTRIIQVKTVPRGVGLSYSHTFVTKRTSRIATLPVGYADGFSRGLSNRGFVLVRGKRCPIVGRVCMDMCLADITQAPAAQTGDQVALIGRQGNSAVTADDLARLLGTISYEVVCAIGKRVPRHVVGGLA